MIDILHISTNQYLRKRFKNLIDDFDLAAGIQLFHCRYVSDAHYKFKDIIKPNLILYSNSDNKLHSKSEMMKLRQLFPLAVLFFFRLQQLHLFRELLKTSKLSLPNTLEINLAVMEKNKELSWRQLQILKQVCMGNPNKEISYRLNISLHTVKLHLSNIYKILKVKNRHQARAAMLFESNPLAVYESDSKF